MSQSLIRWQPARDLLSMREAMDRLFDQAWGKGWPGRSELPEIDSLPLELKESDASLELRAPVPGYKPEEIQVNIEGDVLSIRGEHKSEQRRDTDNYHLREWSTGSFQRLVRLPALVDKDKVEAVCKDGVLTLTLPKSAGQASMKIAVKG